MFSTWCFSLFLHSISFFRWRHKFDFCCHCEPRIAMMNLVLSAKMQQYHTCKHSELIWSLKCRSITCHAELQQMKYDWLITPCHKRFHQSKGIKLDKYKVIIHLGKCNIIVMYKTDGFWLGNWDLMAAWYCTKCFLYRNRWFMQQKKVYQFYQHLNLK